MSRPRSPNPPEPVPAAECDHARIRHLSKVVTHCVRCHVRMHRDRGDWKVSEEVIDVARAEALVVARETKEGI